MRYTVVESGRRSCRDGLATLNDRLWRATERGTVRSMVSMCELEQGATQQEPAVYLSRGEEMSNGKLSVGCRQLGNSGCHSFRPVAFLGGLEAVSTRRQ